MLPDKCVDQSYWEVTKLEWKRLIICRHVNKLHTGIRKVLFSVCSISSQHKTWPNVGLTLAYRRRWWANIELALI